MKLDGFHDCDKDEPWGRMKARKQKTGARDRGIKGPRRRDCGAGTAFQLLAIHCQLSRRLMAWFLAPSFPWSLVPGLIASRPGARRAGSARRRKPGGPGDRRSR